MAGFQRLVAVATQLFTADVVLAGACRRGQRPAGLLPRHATGCHATSRRTGICLALTGGWLGGILTAGKPAGFDQQRHRAENLMMRTFLTALSLMISFSAFAATQYPDLRSKLTGASASD